MSDQCAIAPDGSLMDAADIHWYNDADDAAPIPSALTSTSASSSARSLDDFFSSRPPAKKVSGARQSSRVRKPLKRTTDPDNAEAGDVLEDVRSGQKRKTGGTAGMSRRVSRKVIQSDSDDDTASDDGNKSDFTDVDTNSNEDPNEARATENYENMKALGDKDREVTTFFPMNKSILNLTCRPSKKSRSSNALPMFVPYSNAMTIVSTLTRGGMRKATGVLYASRLTR